MLRASSSSNGQGGELVQVSGLGGTKPSSAAVTVVSGIKTRQKEVGFQIMVGLAQKLEPSLQAGAVGAILAFADAAPTPATRFTLPGKKAMRTWPTSSRSGSQKPLREWPERWAFRA